MLGTQRSQCLTARLFHVVCNFYAEAPFCTLLRPFVVFYALLRTCVSALLRTMRLRSFADLRLRSFALICALLSGSEKGVFWKRGLFRKVHFLNFSRDLENLEILEILENLQTVENKGEPNQFLEILENLEILEIPSVKRPLS